MKWYNMRVNVAPGSISNRGVCSQGGKLGTKKNCGRKAAFMIFVDDGSPRLSRLWKQSCAKHLGLLCKKAHKVNWDIAEDQVEMIAKQEKNAAFVKQCEEERAAKK